MTLSQFATSREPKKAPVKKKMSHPFSRAVALCRCARRSRAPARRAHSHRSLRRRVHSRSSESRSMRSALHGKQYKGAICNGNKTFGTMARCAPTRRGLLSGGMPQLLDVVAAAATAKSRISNACTCLACCNANLHNRLATSCAQSTWRRWCEWAVRSCRASKACSRCSNGSKNPTDKRRTVACTRASRRPAAAAPALACAFTPEHELAVFTAARPPLPDPPARARTARTHARARAKPHSPRHSSPSRFSLSRHRLLAGVASDERPRCTVLEGETPAGSPLPGGVPDVEPARTASRRCIDEDRAAIGKGPAVA